MCVCVCVCVFVSVEGDGCTRQVRTKTALYVPPNTARNQMTKRGHCLWTFKVLDLQQATKIKLVMHEHIN